MKVLNLIKNGGFPLSFVIFITGIILAFSGSVKLGIGLMGGGLVLFLFLAYMGLRFFAKD